MADYGSLPFEEAIAYLKAKTDLPTERWDDIAGQAHDQAFIVAGATKAQLLADLHAEVLAAVEQGISLQDFTNRFEAIVARHGWTGWTGEDTPEGRAWRARTIYQTNLRTAHAAGRLSQMRAIQDARPYWRYRHNDTVGTPRPQHLAWNGLVLAADDPWWQTHYPPCGWGCRCRVETLSPRDLQREGITPDQAPDDGTYEYLDRRTGEVHSLPKGIDYGWDHMPGRTRDLVAEVERQAQGLPTGIQQALRDDVDRLASGPRDRGAAPAAAPLAHAPDPRRLPMIAPERAARLTERARAWVVGQGKRTETEHLVAYDLHTGRELGRASSTLRDEVPIPPQVIEAAAAPTAVVEIHHNHPDNLAPSSYDLSRFAAYPGLYRIQAHGHDGSTFAVTSRHRGGIPDELLLRAHTELVKQLQEAARHGLFYPQLQTHLLALALQKAGLIDYSYRLDPARAQHLAREAGPTEDLITAVAAALRHRP